MNRHPSSYPANPMLQVGPGQATIYNHGMTAPDGNPYFTVAFSSQQSQNGVMIPNHQAYSQGPPIAASIPPNSQFRVPPPNAYSASGAYPAVIPMAPYVYPFAQSHYQQSTAYGPPFGAAQMAPAYANGNGQAYPIQPSAAFVGPAAMDLQIQPTVAVPPQPQPQANGPPGAMVQMQSYGPNGRNAALAAATHPTDQGQSQTLPQRQRREKKPLQVIDPETGEDKLEDVLKEKEQTERVIGIQHHPGGLWKPVVDQQQQQLLAQQQAPVSNLPAGAIVEQRPSRSGSATPHLEEPKNHSGRSISRGQSPAFEAPPQKDKDAIVQEYYSQFADQLANADAIDHSLSEQSSQASHRADDAVLMPPPTTVPPVRPLTEVQSRQSSARTPPPTPPPIPNQQPHSTKPAQTFEFGVQHSSVSSSQASKKPKEIIGNSEIEFGWLNTSAGEQSLETTDGDAEMPAQQEKDVGIGSGSAAVGYCSTPQRHQPPPPDLARGRSPALDSDSGRRSDTAPKPPRDRTYAQHPQSAQSLLNGNSSAERFGFSVNDAAANAFSGNASYDQQDSIEEGEIRDMVFEPSQSLIGNGTRVMTTEERQDALALIEELKQLEAPDGRNCYSHEFMMVAAKLPSSKARPNFKTDRWSRDNVEEVFNLNRQASQNRADARGRPPPQTGAGFAPSWMSGGMAIGMPARPSYPGRTSDTGSMRGDRPGRGSRQGAGRGGSRQQPMIIARPSIDVELKTAENAWKPAHKADAIEDPEVAETKKLFKEVRGILNKITPQTFPDLADEFLNLEPRMNTAERARGVVDIVFQKAVDEPSFCTTYSDLYDRMTRHQLSQQTSAKGNNQQQPTKGSVNATNRDTNFRWILLNKCQSEFERDKRSETIRQEKEAAIANAETPEQKKQLQDELEEFLMKEKRRTLGNMRFIGELYLKSMLTSKIMHRCIMELMKTDDDESLECLCKLLTTIGARLDKDDKEPGLVNQCEVYYQRLKELSAGLSSRVRFMIMDLLELRANGWTPRRKGEGPKTIEQLHQDAAKEKFEQQQALLLEERKKQETANQDGRRGGGGGGRRDVPNRPSYGPQDRSDHDGRGGKGERGGRGDRDQNRQGGRSGAGASNQQLAQPSADLSKAKAPTLSQHLGGTDAEVRLGPSKKEWGKPRGATAGAAAAATRQAEAPQTKLTNRFDHLSRAEGSAPGSRDSSQTRQDDGQERNIAARKSSGASTMPKYPAEEDRPATAATGDDTGRRNSDLDSVRDSMPSTSEKPPAASSQMMEEHLKRDSREMLDELVDANNFADALKEIDEKSQHAERIFWHLMNYVLEKNEKQRPKAIRMLGTLIAHSFTSDQRKGGVLSGLSSFIRYVIDEDISQDVPKIWTYIGQVLGTASAPENVQDIDLIEFSNVFRDASYQSSQLLAQTLLAISTNASKDKAIAKWYSVADRLSDLGIDNPAELESLFRRRDLEFLFEAPSEIDASSSSGSISKPVDASADATSSLPSSISSSTTAASVGVSGQADGSSIASRALSSELDPDLVEMERFVKMGDTVDVDGLIDFVEKSGRLKDDDERSLNFLGALVKSLCSKLIVAGDTEDSVDVDEDEFKRCSKILIRFATQRSRLEMKALGTLAEVCCSKNCPKGLLVKMLSMLHEGSVIPTETFQEWWDNTENLPGMLRASGEIKAFFSRFAADTASDAGSDSDQGE